MYLCLMMVVLCDLMQLLYCVFRGMSNSKVTAVMAKGIQHKTRGFGLGHGRGASERFGYSDMPHVGSHEYASC